MSGLGLSPRGSTTPRLGPTLFSGQSCLACPFRSDCAAADTVEACGDPAEYPLAIHPRTTPLSATEPTSLPAFRTSAPVGFGDTLIVTNGARHRSITGVRLLNALASLDRKPTTTRTHSPGAVAVMLGVDQRIDRAWRHYGRLGRSLVADGFSCAISPGYSTWRSDSPFASRVAMLQSAHMAAELGRHLPTIPTIVWRYWNDLDQWVTWIEENHVAAIAVDSGSLRDDREWNASIEDLKYLSTTLLRRCGRLPRLLLSGPSIIDRIASAVASWSGPLTIVSQKPWLLAVRRIALHPDLQTEPAARGETTDALLTENATAFASAVRLVLLDAGRPSVDMLA